MNEHPEPPAKLITANMLARWADVSIPTMNSLIRGGTLKPVKFGESGVPLFNPDAPEVVAWLRAVRGQPVPRLMMIDEAQAALHDAGWSTGDSLVKMHTGHLWHVYAHRGEEKIVAKSASQAEAWREAARLAAGSKSTSPL